MNKWIKLLLGLLFVVAAIYCWGMNYYGFGTAALEILKGGVVWFVIMLGVGLILLGISEIKED
jgi:predicted phage tail protein